MFCFTDLFVCILSTAHYLDYCYYTRSWSLVVSVQLCCCSSVLYWLFWVFCFYIQTLESVCWHPQNVIWNIFFYADVPPLYLQWYTPSVEKTLYFLPSFVKVDCVYMGLFLGSVLFHWSVSFISTKRSGLLLLYSWYISSVYPSFKELVLWFLLSEFYRFPHIDL